MPHASGAARAYKASVSTIIGIGLVLVVACVLTSLGCAFFFYLANNPRTTSDGVAALSDFILVSVGVAVGAFGLRVARRSGCGQGAGNLLGVVFTVTSVMTLGFGVSALHDHRAIASAVQPRPENLPLPYSIGVFALLSGLEIAAALVWLIKSGKASR